jgi:hypothetical protein
MTPAPIDSQTKPRPDYTNRLARQPGVIGEDARRALGANGRSSVLAMNILLVAASSKL